MVSAVVKIQQFDIGPGITNVRDFASFSVGNGSVRDIVSSKSGQYIQIHLPAVSNPVARSSHFGWPTGNEEKWSDSPANKPYLLYRHRFGWGRDNREIFPQPALNLTSLNLGEPGQRWGTLQSVHGVLIYEELYPFSSQGRVSSFLVKGVGRVLQKNFGVSSRLENIRHLETVSSDTTIEEFPFLLIATPEPHSIKNPVDTDVFIRLSNFTNPIASGTITLYLDDVVRPNLLVQEFFGGLGGFNVTWDNNSVFDYDARVDVRWEFSDTDVPANKLVIRYPFYTVKDLAGPRVSSLVPNDDSVGIPVSQTIQFDVEDFESGVNITSLKLYVNNLLVVDGLTGDLETIPFENGKGYTVRYTTYTPWLHGDLIPVAIFIQDSSKNKNETLFTYSFTTEESISPRLINLKPAPCTVQVPVDSHVSLDVIDGGDGLDKNYIIFTLDELEHGGSVLLIPIVHRDD